MKKLSFLIILLVFLILLNGCDMLVIEEDTFEYRQLSDQYNDYVMNDVVNYEDFKDIMNDVTHVSTTSVFMIETQVLDIFRRVVSENFGTGTLIYTDNNYHYVLTTFQMINLQSRFVEYYVTDAYGNKLSAEIFAADSTLKLGILRIGHTDEEYALIDLPSYMPLSGELLVMISNNHPTQNIQKLGSYLYQDEMSYIKVESTQNANGSPIFNLQLELVGIQYLYGESYVLMIDYQTIYEFASPILPIWRYQ